MGIFGAIIGAAKGKINEQKQAAELAYNEAIHYNNDDNLCFEYAVRQYKRASKDGNQAKAAGYIKAINVLGKSENIYDSTLKYQYEDIERSGNTMLLKLLQNILVSRDLLERDGEQYIKMW